MGRNAWDSMNDVEIFGDPAQEIQEINDSLTVKYKGKEYTNADRINIGVSGTESISAYTSGDGVPWSYSVPVSTPTKVYKVTIPSWIAPFLAVTSVKIGPWELIDGEAIAADVWTEVSRNNQVVWPTVETSQTITFRGVSFATSAVTMRQPRITLFAVRLR